MEFDFRPLIVFLVLVGVVTGAGVVGIIWWLASR